MNKSLDKKKGTQFQPGQSGNPAGRPKGAKGKTTLLREVMQTKSDRLLSRAVPAILRVVIQQALKGCVHSQKIILDRAVPVQKATEGEGHTGLSTVHITIQNLTSPHEEDTPGVTISGELV